LGDLFRPGVGVLLDGWVVFVEVGFHQNNGADSAGGFDDVFNFRSRSHALRENEEIGMFTASKLSDVEH
jgi:hypothetical protein